MASMEWGAAVPPMAPLELSVAVSAECDAVCSVELARPAAACRRLSLRSRLCLSRLCLSRLLR